MFVKSRMRNYSPALDCVSATKVQGSSRRGFPNDRENRTSPVQDGVRFRSGGGNSGRGMDGRMHAKTVKDRHGQSGLP